MKIENVIYENTMRCPECGGPAFDNLLLAEKKDACYHKVKATAKVWPSAYASGRLVQCRKKGAANWGNKSESVAESDTGDTPIDSMTVQELAEYLGVSERQVTADIEHARDMAREKAQDLTEEFDLIESIIDRLAEHNGVAAEAIWEDLESLTDDELYVFAVTTPLMEDWQKANKQDRTDGMSRKAVNAYRRENPGSKLKTAVTTKPSKLKRGSKASKRRSSYCSRSRGQMKMHSISCAKTPDKAICKARRRWNCESVDFNLSEMDKTLTPPGRDGDIDWTKKQIHLGPESTIKAKDIAKHGLKALDKAMKKSHADTPKKKGVAEGSAQKYLWHGSRQPIQMLEPRQAVDTGGAAGSNQNAIYATGDPKVAIAMGLTAPGSDTAMFPNDPQMVLFGGKIRKGENVYLHKLPMNGPDGKPQFVQGAHDREFHSVPGVKGIKPTEIKAVPVDKYLNLIRQATPQDLELRKKYMKQGVAEAERQPGSFSGAWQILVNGKKVHSFRGNFDQETADRVGVVKAASRGLYNPGSGDKIKIVPVMLDQKQGVAEAGPFSYGKAPRKGSVADLAAKKRREQEKSKQPIEPKDQQVGVAKVTKGVAEGSVTKKPQPYNDPDWLKKLSKKQLDALAGSKYKKDKKEQGMAEGSLEEIDRRGFLKGLGAAAVAGAAGGVATKADAQEVTQWTKYATDLAVRTMGRLHQDTGYDLRNWLVTNVGNWVSDYCRQTNSYNAKNVIDTCNQQAYEASGLDKENKLVTAFLTNMKNRYQDFLTAYRAGINEAYQKYNSALQSQQQQKNVMGNLGRDEFDTLLDALLTYAMLKDRGHENTAQFAELSAAIRRFIDANNARDYVNRIYPKAKESVDMLKGNSDVYQKEAAQYFRNMKNTISKLDQISSSRKPEFESVQQGVAEGKMAELDMDLEDPEISDREFEKIYGMTRNQAREEFSKTNMWDIPDLRDPKRPLHERDVDEGRAKPEINFDIEDIKRLEQIENLESIKQQAFELISRPSAHPMKPEKVSWFKSALERMDSPMKVIKLMYDLYLSGEGKSVLGTRHSMDPNSYRRRFGESKADDNPVANAIYRRLMNQKPDLFTRYGLEYVAQAVQDVADSVGRLGPDDEIGSSDVSGWVRQVEQNLQDKINQYDEPMSDIDRMEETHRPGHQSSGKNPDDLIGGRYEPDEFDQMVLRLKAMAEKQQRERGPVDLKDLARRLQGIK